MATCDPQAKSCSPLQNKLYSRMHAQSYPILCDLMDCSPPGSSVHGVLQAGILEWVAISYCRGSCRARDRTHISCGSCTGADALPLSRLGSPSKLYAAAAAKSRQACPALCDPIDGSPPGSSIPGILQARVLEWGAITFSE